MSDTGEGNLRVRPMEVRPLPDKGNTAVYILTSAQNNTGLHEACWANLKALARYTGAEIMVGAFTYHKPSVEHGQKRKTAKERGYAEEIWDKAITPYLADSPVELAPGLVWCGELQILPTAVNPISGLESYTGRESSIIPHVKHAVQSVASSKGRGTKFVYTTGTVTLRNYVQKKAGQKAEFHHSYGALIAEVNSDGDWFVRQLCADSEGVIYDLDRKIDKGRVTVGHRPSALIWGDIHTRALEPDMRLLAWGKNGILDQLRPHCQVMHDVLDFRSQNHHDRNDPWRTFKKFTQAGLDVQAEVDEVARFLAEASRPWCETVVVAANHDEALDRWLKETTPAMDPLNARFWLKATLAAYDAMHSGLDFMPLLWATHGLLSMCRTNVKFLQRDEEYVVEGVELGMHGDLGTNGARGSIPSYGRTGRKCVVGHSHTAGWREGAMQVGVMGNLDMGYNRGQSSWSHTNALVYANGKRSLFTIWRGVWKG